MNTAQQYAQVKGRSAAPASDQSQMFKFELKGIPELVDFFDRLSYPQKQSIVLSNWRKAAKPMVNAMKGNVRAFYVRRSGNLVKSIGTRKLGRKPYLGVGARTYGSYKGYAAHLVALGTAPRQTKSGANRGAVTGRDFIQLAVDQTSKQVVKAFENSQIETLQAWIQRANKRNKR